CANSFVPRTPDKALPFGSMGVLPRAPAWWLSLVRLARRPSGHWEDYGKSRVRGLARDFVLTRPPDHQMLLDNRHQRFIRLQLGLARPVHVLWKTRWKKFVVGRP